MYPPTNQPRRRQKFSRQISRSSRIRAETSFKDKAYDALKEAILKMDLYGKPEPVMLDERELSDRLGVSRTPVREAMAMLEQDGFVQHGAAPRHHRGQEEQERNRRHDPRLGGAGKHGGATDHHHCAQERHQGAARFRRGFGKDRLPQDHVEEYSTANIAFHQALISLSGSPLLVDMTNDILLHVRGYPAIDHRP